MAEAQDFRDGTAELISACIEVHRHLGPGLLEAVYEKCLCRELELRGIPFTHQQPLALVYKGASVGFAYRTDVTVNGTIIIEIKSVEQLLPLHEAQLRSYLKLANFETGFLINFNVVRLKYGIRRINVID